MLELNVINNSLLVSFDNLSIIIWQVVSSDDELVNLFSEDGSNILSFCRSTSSSNSSSDVEVISLLSVAQYIYIIYIYIYIYIYI